MSARLELQHAALAFAAAQRKHRDQHDDGREREAALKKLIEAAERFGEAVEQL